MPKTPRAAAADVDSAMRALAHALELWRDACADTGVAATGGTPVRDKVLSALDHHTKIRYTGSALRVQSFETTEARRNA